MKFDILDEQGNLANTIVADLAFVEEHYPGHFREVADDSDPAPPLRRITKLAFRNRFTNAEKIAIDLASIDDPAAAPEARQQSAAVRVSLADAAAATYINLDDPDTRTGVQMLEAAGIIGAGRALEILDADIQPGEQPE